MRKEGREMVSSNGTTLLLQHVHTPMGQYTCTLQHTREGDKGKRGIKII